MDSFFSSHLSGLFNRKPGGGGPEGVADVGAVVENAASELAVGAKGRREFDILDSGRLRTTSIVKGFADAMMWLLVASGCY